MLVDIAEPGVQARLTTIKTGALTWRQMNEHVTVEGALAEIARTLSRMTDPGSTLIELGLSGLLFGCDADELIRIDKACARFLYARVDRTGLRPAPADNSWLEKLPPD